MPVNCPLYGTLFSNRSKNVHYSSVLTGRQLKKKFKCLTEMLKRLLLCLYTPRGYFPNVLVVVVVGGGGGGWCAY